MATVQIQAASPNPNEWNGCSRRKLNHAKSASYQKPSRSDSPPLPLSAPSSLDGGDFFDSIRNLRSSSHVTLIPAKPQVTRVARLVSGSTLSSPKIEWITVPSENGQRRPSAPLSTLPVSRPLPIVPSSFLPKEEDSPPADRLDVQSPLPSSREEAAYHAALNLLRPPAPQAKSGLQAHSDRNSPVYPSPRSSLSSVNPNALEIGWETDVTLPKAFETVTTVVASSADRLVSKRMSLPYPALNQSETPSINPSHRLPPLQRREQNDGARSGCCCFSRGNKRVGQDTSVY